MRLYTRKGDDGYTGLFGGQRVRKDDSHVAAYGTVDELNAVLGWAACRDRQGLRRLQLAAEQSRCLAVLFRGPEAAREPSPAVLRIALEGSCSGLAARILKSRGGRPACVQLGWIGAAASTRAH